MTIFHNFKNVLFISALATVLLLSGTNLFNAKAAPIVFPFGVESGDVMSKSAVLWTKVDSSASVDLEVSMLPTFSTVDFKHTVVATPGNDYTLKYTVNDLNPDTQYYYRWKVGSTYSDMGQFKTAPLETEATNVHFTWSGDTDPSVYPTNRYFGSWDALKTALAEKPNFFIYLGDVIYSDLRANTGYLDYSKHPPKPITHLDPVYRLDEFRNIYKQQKDSMRYPDLELTPVYALWDDHEVRSDWAGQTVDKTIYGYGKKAFNEYMPIQEPWAASDPYCAGPAQSQYRTIHWGSNADIIILDTRSCRSASAEEACKRGGQTDLIPLLPNDKRKEIRDNPLLSGVKPYLFPTQSDKCVKAIYDPERTMLGAKQLGAFENDLKNSKAKFKFVITSVNMQQTYVTPYDSWEGYGAERSEILNYIKTNKIQNVIFLSTDTHENLFNKVYIDSTKADSDSGAYEFVTGPVAALTGKNLIGNPLGKALSSSAVDAYEYVLNKIVRAECFNLDVYSYGSVSLSQTNKLVTITLKDKDGNIVKNEGTSGKTCIKTFGLS